jgi:hypothetical protein
MTELSTNLAADESGSREQNPPPGLMPHRSRWTGGAGWGAVACTRKNVPGTKRFAVAAVKAGGAVMHRLGLSETVLVFPEHCAFLGKEPFVGLAEKLRRAAPEKPGAFTPATSPLMHKPVRMSWLPHRPIWRSRAMCM